MFDLNTLAIKLIGLATLVVAGVALFFYIKALQAEVTIQKQNVDKLQIVVNQQKSVMDQMQKDFAKIQAIQKDLGTQIQKAQGDVTQLSKTFNQSKATKKPRNFTNIAEKKPGLIQILINNGTEQAARCNEVVTGSPLTADESAGKVRNTVCPALIPYHPQKAVSK